MKYYIIVNNVSNFLVKRHFVTLQNYIINGQKLSRINKTMQPISSYAPFRI